MRPTLLALMLLALPALAQSPAGDEAPTRTRFYDFDELQVTGDTVKPNVAYTDAKLRARFDRLFSLKRSFLPELRRTADGTTVVRPAEKP